MKLVDYLRKHAQSEPNKLAIVCPREVCTYSQLLALSEEKAKNILSSECKLFPFRVSHDVDFFVTYFAIHIAGCVAIPFENDIPDKTYNDIIKSIENCEIPNGIADILYTTGTTGEPKGVMISHEAIIANAENLIEAHEYTSNLIFIINGPLNHIGSLSKVYPMIVLGGTIYLVNGMKDLSVFYSALDYPCYKMATFLVPTSIRILLKLSADDLAKYADKIDFIETGASPISKADMHNLCKVLPKSRLYNTYASTETGIISTYNFNDGKCLEGCVGIPMKHSQIEISDLGLITCKGRTLMSGYVGDQNLTNEVLHNGMALTHDIGYIDEERMLHLLGRNDDIINLGGYKVNPIEIENVAMEIFGIKDCICIATSHPISGKVLKLLVVKNTDYSGDYKNIASFLKSRLESYKIPSFYEFVSKIKRTYNGKLDRKFYFTL